MKKILLVGISGTYNYGCEAIVRGTVNILKKYNPTLEIFYASYNYEDDIKRLTNCDVNIINRNRKGIKWLLMRIVKKFLAVIGFEYVLPYDSISWILKKNIDTIFSIGGDIYTLPVGKSYKKALTFFCEKCLTHKLKYVLWGSSVGPFDNNPEALKYYKSHLKKINLITARENKTVQYLQNIGIVDNVMLAPDPAFFVSSVSDTLSSDKFSPETIGINLSPLSAIFEYKSIEKGLEVQIRAISDILDKTKYDIFLISHVLSPANSDNDLWYLKRLHESMQLKYKDRIKLIEEDMGFLGLRKYISQCSFVIAARMHCAINAVTCGVPVIFLAYSEKAKGMAEFIYNSTDIVVPLSEFRNSDNMVNLMNNWNYKSNINEIKKFDFDAVLKACE